VLRRLSDQFELCSNGLRQVRKEWEGLPRTVAQAWTPDQN